MSTNSNSDDAFGQWAISTGLLKPPSADELADGDHDASEDSE